jgi:hypothetical protein
MGKTVGILTYQRAYNFGAVLQAFALQRTIAELGHSCSIIDYRAPDESASYPVFRLPRDRSSLSADALLLLNLRSHLRSSKRYEFFRSAHLALTTESFRTVDELRERGPRFDVYVSGSDQVWHPTLLERPGGPVFFQEFVKSGRRVAYAPSFGVTEVAPEHRPRLAEAIGRFDFLSAREDTGCAIIRGLTGREPEHVVDPTLLQGASSYDEVAVESGASGPYILLYATERSDALRDLAVQLRSSMKLPIVAVLPWFFSPSRFAFADRLVYDAGPGEFLGWMKGAALVCTNSFHGMCFSVIYRKRFLGVPHPSTGTRQRSLLNELGLAARLVDQPERAEVDASLLEPLDYAAAEPRLQRAVDRSMRFLAGALA